MIGFSDRWHNIRIFMDNVYDRISVILDEVLVFESVPRSSMAYFSPAISLSVGPGNANEVEVDDVSVIAFYLLEGKQLWTTLFNEDFGRLKEKNDLENSGWRTKGERIVGSNQEEGRKGAFVALDPVSEMKTLTIKSIEEENVMVVKSFNIPVDFPFDISDKNFEIRYNEDMNSDTAAYDGFTGHGGSVISAGNFYLSSSSTLRNSAPGISRTSELFNTWLNTIIMVTVSGITSISGTG